MTPIDRHRDQLRRSLRGPAWHGAALLEILDDVAPGEAYARPLTDVHTIAEIAAHSLGWIEEVTARLRGGRVGLPARGDWPAQEEQDSAAWTELRILLGNAGGELDLVLATFPVDRLFETVGGEVYDPPTGSGVTYDLMLHGLAQHNAYHGGQISLLKLALRRAPHAASDSPAFDSPAPASAAPASARATRSMT
jgi:uncharacterized damage-inducible protein DinB